MKGKNEMANNIDDLIKEEQRIYKQQWRDKNKEHLRKYQKEYRQKNKEKITNLNREYWLRKARQRAENQSKTKEV